MDKQENQNSDEEKIGALLDSSFQLNEKLEILVEKTIRLHEKMEHQMRQTNKQMSMLLSMVTEKFKNQNDSISKYASIAASTEDALLNVLLAIKQNEYLQAYYPEQLGYQAMKVVGSHPSRYTNQKA